MSSLSPDSGAECAGSRDLLVEPFPPRVRWDGVLNLAGKHLIIHLGCLLHPGNFLGWA